MFEVVNGDENLPPLEGELNVSVLVPDAESVYHVGPFVLTSDQIVFLDITLMHEGNAVRLDRMIRISFPVTEELIEKITGKTLYIFTEEGGMIRIDYEITDGKIVFETDTLGAVIFIDETAFMQPEEAPETPAIMGYNESVSEPVPMQANEENGPMQAFASTGTQDNTIFTAIEDTGNGREIHADGSLSVTNKNNGGVVNLDPNGAQSRMTIFDENSNAVMKPTLEEYNAQMQLYFDRYAEQMALYEQLMNTDPNP